MKKNRMFAFIGVALIASLTLTSCGSNGGEKTTAEVKTPIKVGIVTSLSGALESYGKTSVQGFELGLSYATDGKNEVAGHPIQIIKEDDMGKPDVAKQKALKLLDDDKVDFLMGCASSANALAILPLAQDYKRIMLVEPAVADSITGAQWNKYIFKTSRNSSQDAMAVASAIAGSKPGANVAILAQDYAFGHDGAKAFVTAAATKGLKVGLQEFAAMNATDFTANVQRIINAKPDYLFVIWAGSAGTPWKMIQDMKLADQGIKIITGTPEIAAMKTMQNMVGQEGYSVYYYGLPKNKINDWLVEQNQKQYGSPPDLFTPGGFSAAVAMVQALQKTNGDANADKLITVMEGMSFETPKGTMTFRKEDHQALQTLYHIRFETKAGFDYPVPTLIREIKPEETVPPIMNKS